MNPVRLFSAFYCGAIASFVCLKHQDQLRYVRIMRGLESPGRLLGRWQIPRLSDAEFHFVGAAFVFCLLLATTATASRIALIGAILLYFLYFGQFLGVSYVARKSNLIPQILLVLLVSGEVNAPFKSISAGWPLFLIQAVVVQVYLSSAYSKLRNAGLHWVAKPQIESILLTHHLSYDIPVAFELANKPGLCTALSVLVLAFESSFWLVLVWPRLGLAYAVFAILFHLGTFLFMRINYLMYQGPAFFVFMALPFCRHLGLS